MGVYDRDYMSSSYDDGGGYRRYSPSNGFGRSGGWSMTTYIILVNVALFLLNGLLTPDESGNIRGTITGFCAMWPASLANPLHWYQFLTYGFVHSPGEMGHIFFNMLGLFFLGRSVERRIGSAEYLRFYLTAIIIGGVCHGLLNIQTNNIPCIGASGGVVAVIILFTLMFPRQLLYIWGVFPVPAWILGLVVVGMDFLGAMGKSGGGIAYSVHLAGAGFAFVYFTNRWNLGKWFGYLFFRRGPGVTHKPKYTIFQDKTSQTDKKDKKTDTFAEKTAAALKEERLDLILKKYSRYGEAALSQEEKDFLMKMSEEYRQKHGR